MDKSYFLISLSSSVHIYILHILISCRHMGINSNLFSVLYKVILKQSSELISKCLQRITFVLTTFEPTQQEVSQQVLIVTLS